MIYDIPVFELDEKNLRVIISGNLAATFINAGNRPVALLGCISTLAGMSRDPVTVSGLLRTLLLFVLKKNEIVFKTMKIKRPAKDPATLHNTDPIAKSVTEGDGNLLIPVDPTDVINVDACAGFAIATPSDLFSGTKVDVAKFFRVGSLRRLLTTLASLMGRTLYHF